MAESLELELQQIADRLNARLSEHTEDGGSHFSHFAGELLEDVNAEIGGSGVEGILDELKGIDIQYVNTGDGYVPTVLYDGRTGSFLAGAWGDLVQQYEAEYQVDREHEMYEMAKTLTAERSDEIFWNEYHGSDTPDDALAKAAMVLGSTRVLEVYDRRKDIELSYVDMGAMDELTLIYDAIDDIFLAESVSSVLERKNREYEIEHTRFESIARRLNRELGYSVEWGGRKRDESIDYMLAGVLDGYGGGGVIHDDSRLYIYVKRDGGRSHTIIYDVEEDKFLASDLDTLREDRIMERERSEAEAASTEAGQSDEKQEPDAAGIDAIHQAALEGLTVYIGEEQYYVRSTNKFFANLYPMADIDALPDEIDGQPVDWEALKETPFLLAGEIRWARLNVTDYFLDIEDFRDAVIGNTRNAEIIEKMGLVSPERDDVLIPVLQTDGSPYYTVGDKVYIGGEERVEIFGIGNGYVWCTNESNSPWNVAAISQRGFEYDFFKDPRNSRLIEYGENFEQSGAKQVISSVNLPMLVERLNRECEDRQAWGKANPGKTVRDWLEEIARDIKFASYGPLGEPPKGTDLWRINLKGRDESLFYDYIDQKFMSGKTEDVLRLKEEEHTAYLGRLESLAERLNDRLPGFDESGTPNRRHFVTDLLAEANTEIRGDGVFTSSDEERGVYVRYVDKNFNPYIPTILYDGHEGKFLAGSRNDLEKKQEREHEEDQTKEANQEKKPSRSGSPLEPKPAKEYDINFAHLGNGLTVWNRLEERNGDYVTIAHISRYREVRFYDDDLPEDVKEQILDIARTSDARISATQDVPVFSTPPQAPEQRHDTPEPEPEEPDEPKGVNQPQASEPEPQVPVKSILDDLDWPKPRNKTEEFRQEFTKKIISLMEQGEAFWQKPWTSPDTGLPMNAVSGKRYNGVNIAYLLVAGLDKGYSDPRWMTYKQAEEKGWHVRAGEHGTKVEFYTEYDPSKTKKGADILDQKIQAMMDRGASQEEIEKAMEDQKVLVVKTYTVFNASQVEGIEPLQPDVPEAGSEFRSHDRAEAIMDNCGVPIQYGQNRAFYSPSRDVIGMPNKEWFNTPEHFYATVLHEIAHSTGHPSRMNREDLSNPFGSAQYALEELRAEMASAFMFQEIGMNLSPENMEGYVGESAAYNQHWLGTLKDDYKEFFKAVRDATKIADYTLAYEQAHTKGHDAANISKPGEQIPSPEAAKTTASPVHPVQAAKEIIGQGAIVTNAQPGRNYTGEILQVGKEHVIQKIGADRAIIHDLNRIGDSNELIALLQLPKDDRRVSISYDRDRNASVKTDTREEERESAQTR